MPGLTLKDKKAWAKDWTQWGVLKYGAELLVNVTEEQFNRFADHTVPVVLDCEDDEQGNFVGLGMCWNSVRILYFSTLPGWLIRFLSGAKIVAHFGLSDIKKLQQWGVEPPPFLGHDTSLLAHVLDSSKAPCGLKDLAKKDLGIEYPHYEQIVGSKKAKSRITLDKQPLELVSNYNGLDVLSTYKEWQLQKKTLYPGAVEYVSRLEEPVSRIFERMSERGVRLDLQYLKELSITLANKRDGLVTEIQNDLGHINLNSTKQLLGALNAKEIHPIFKNKPSTDKRALERFRGNRIVDNLLQFSELETLLTSFVKPYLERGQEVVHPHFNQCGTRTGRPSCSNPNLLQIPRRTENGKLVRRMFIANEGHVFGDSDYGQIEPRVLAHFSGDQNLSSLFNDGIDFHAFTSERLSIDRDKAKILNLSVGYRATHKSVAQQLKVCESEAQTEIDNWWSLFPQLKAWEENLIWDSKKSGYCTTLLGRRIKIEGLDQWNKWKREHAERQLINNLIQGSAAEIMKLGMIECEKSNIQMLLQLYDELLFEIPQDDIAETVEKVRINLTSCIDLDVPLTVDCGIGNNWTDAKEKKYEES